MVVSYGCSVLNNCSSTKLRLVGVSRLCVDDFVLIYVLRCCSDNLTEKNIS